MQRSELHTVPTGALLHFFYLGTYITTIHIDAAIKNVKITAKEITKKLEEKGITIDP